MIRVVVYSIVRRNDWLVESTYTEWYLSDHIKLHHIQSILSYIAAVSAVTKGWIL